MYTTSLPLYQISNFFTSPFTFSVIPTALIYRKIEKVTTFAGQLCSSLTLYSFITLYHQ